MIREIFDIYNRNWLQILIWSFVIILPATTLSFLSVIYVNGTEGVLLPQYLSGLAIFINFIICIPPFMKMVMLDEMDEMISPKEGILLFLRQFGLHFIFTLLIFVIAILGTYLLFVPSIIAMFFLLLFPFFSEARTVKGIIVDTFKAMAKQNITLLGDLIVIISVNVGIWAVIMIFFEQYDNNIFAFLLVRNLMNVLIFPLLYIYLTLRYRREEITQTDLKGWR